MSWTYEDILYRSRPVSKKHPPMSAADRAAQFAPFAALTGHDAVIRETARVTDGPVELDRDRREELDAQLRELAEQYDAWDKMQASIYARKTGLPEAEILGMMSEPTYMTGTEAAAKGFADEVIDDADPLAIAASQDGRALYIGTRTVHLAPGMTAPESLQKTEAPEVWRERMLARLSHKEE